MEQEILTLLQQMNVKMDKQFERVHERLDKVEMRLDKIEDRLDKIEVRLDKVETRLDQHERLLDSIIKMTAQNSEDITTLREETIERIDKLELSYYKMTADINLLFQETQQNKRDIAHLKSL
ncbi:hemolysin XhlA family protein [Alkalihalobacillus sp. MEB130]|uniref:hypothetical protein n=1 Tax=Alkalihalobacillus sp. MEB130 TaxID=2976704 RepID=UPI0028DDC22F|nr:hypothetical protein [Alkalihalobacillus sp. MEB130]MDT8858786.1 hemolysin XhlA family protein [Alkalihalobacillus sp. MEB130]